MIKSHTDNSVWCHKNEISWLLGYQADRSILIVGRSRGNQSLHMNHLLDDQSAQRQRYLEAILASDSPRKLIVAGPGTGKTYTIGRLFRNLPPGNKLALTFIRKLVADMNRDLGDIAEVRTFHSYCKLLLHRRFGGIDLIPFLTLIIREDAEAAGLPFSHFTDAFQTLQVDSPEVAYYLARGNYYRAVCFDDSVFRVYQAVNSGTLALPEYVQVVVDEFQDFNPLEVALIEQLQQHNPILIVGDDDQAVYSPRNASPDFLRYKWRSGEYQVFELPYCTRCPRVVVEATDAFVDAVLARGGFVARVPRPFAPYLEEKAYENATYPRIVAATTANIAGLSSFIQKALSKIPERDIADAYTNNYPCVLIVGQRQYLNPLYKRLRELYPHVAFTQAETIGYSLVDGYELLMESEDSNLGWRVLAGCELPRPEWSRAIALTHDGTPVRSFLSPEFVLRHLSVLRVLEADQLGVSEATQIAELLGAHAQAVIDHYFPTEPPEEPPPDVAHPSILLSSFEGCKGLSAGHVLIVGLNNGVVPHATPAGDIADIEYSKFIVAMTRTRKALYLLSNRWDYAPAGHARAPSVFLDMIPQELRDDCGYLKVADIHALWGDR